MIKPVSGCLFVPTAIMVGYIVISAILAPSNRTAIPQSPPIVHVAPNNQRILESNDIHNCRVKPLESYFSNQRAVIANGEKFIVYCDPNYPGLSRCCYKD